MTSVIIYTNILNVVPYPINCDGGQIQPFPWTWIQNLSDGLEDKIPPIRLGLLE